MGGRLIIVVSALAAIVCKAAPEPDALPAHPKLVYRQIGGGYTLGLETGRLDKTFFLCNPSKANCMSTTEIGWRKPFIIYRGGAVLMRTYNTIDTTDVRHRPSPNLLQNVPRYSAAAAWEKLSPTKPLW